MIIINLPKEEGIHKRQNLYKVSTYKIKNTKPKRLHLGLATVENIKLSYTFTHK